MKRDVFQGIADPTRREILVLLTSEPMTPNTLAEQFRTSRQAVSKHIQVLAECQLVKQQKQGREIYYHLNAKKLKEVEKWLEQFGGQVEEHTTLLDRVLQNFMGSAK